MATKKAAQPDEQAPEQPIEEIVESHVVFQAGPRVESFSEAEKAARIAAIDEEIRQVELETKLIQLEQAKRSNQEFKLSEETKKRLAEEAQQSLAIEAHNLQTRKDSCAHLSGGFGIEDFLDGDDRPALIRTELPVAGLSLIICVRCHGEWRTPNPKLKKTNPDKYVEEMIEWKAILKLERKSLSKPMGGPGFTFTDSNGVPVIPDLK